MPVIAIAASAKKLLDQIAGIDFEKVKCRAGGRRLRTACKTVSPGDAARFRAGQVAQYLVGERVADVQAALGFPVDGHMTSLASQTGLTYEDIAELHLSAFVPTCLNIEAGRHTCHPEEAPGRLFYEAARLTMQDAIRGGHVKWRRAPRGAENDDRAPSVPAPSVPAPPAVGRAGIPALAVAAAALLLLSRR
jgi:hypothetical protein